MYGAETKEDNLRIFSDKLREKANIVLQRYGFELLELTVIDYIKSDSLLTENKFTILFDERLIAENL